jgi:hypothetical protein
MSKKVYTLILALSLAFNLIIIGQTKSDSIETKIIQVKNVKDLDKWSWNFSDTFSIEITGLYSILKVLPDLCEDSTIVKPLLIKNGFTQVDFGTGNWKKGPRFIYLKFVKGDCTCKTYKKYYYNQKQADETYDLRISEKIICNSDNFMED